MSKKLEEFRIFPFIAWGLIIGFAAFTYSLANNLNDQVGSLESRVTLLEQYLNKP